MNSSSTKRNITIELTNKKNYNVEEKSLTESDIGIVVDLEKIIKIWEIEVKQLFDEDRHWKHILEENHKGPSILKSEIEKAILTLKNKKPQAKTTFTVKYYKSYVK